MNLFIGFFTIILILVSLFMVMIILMQKPRSDSGLGAALGGGGAADAAFGAETANVLSRSTIYCAIFFFVASFGLYLGHMYVTERGPTDMRTLPELRALEEPAGGAAVQNGQEAVGQDAYVPPPEPSATPPEPTPLP
jgi:preprotein translocase subunit SecG